jgi:hypothetical protein
MGLVVQFMASPWLGLTVTAKIRVSQWRVFGNDFDRNCYFRRVFTWNDRPGKVGDKIWSVSSDSQECDYLAIIEKRHVFEIANRYGKQKQLDGSFAISKSEKFPRNPPRKHPQTSNQTSNSENKKGQHEC